MRLPTVDLVPDLTVRIGKMRGTVARHIVIAIGFRVWKWRWPIIILSKEVRLGNWKFKQIHSGMAPLTDEDLTITALNEEYLHEAIFHVAGLTVSGRWDNFSFDIRAFINGV